MAIETEVADQIFFDKSLAILLNLNSNFSSNFDNLDNSNIILSSNSIFSEGNKLDCSDNTTPMYTQTKRFYQFFAYITSYA